MIKRYRVSMKKRIFISYKRDDKDIVFKIKDDIEKNVGEMCWIDLDDIKCDVNYFVDVITKSIDEADIFLFMYSKKHTEITDFENDWPLRELNYAREEKKRIVFLNIDGTPLLGWFKLMFSMKQQIDVTSTKVMNKFYRDLSKWLGKEDANNADVDNNNVKVNDVKGVVYKVRANRACWLYIDDEKMQQLDANKTAKFQLESGVYLRKVVDCEEDNVSKEDKITLFEKQVFDDIDLATLYQKYQNRNTVQDVFSRIWIKSTKTSQILGWIISACFLCAFVFCVVVLLDSKPPMPGSSSNNSLVDTINFSVLDSIVDLSQNIAREKDSVQFQVGESKKGPSISQSKPEKENVVIPKQPQRIMVNAHECVDLGLSVKWATCNVGADSPEDYGDYFAWGEVESKTTYDWSTYKYGLDYNKLTKYSSKSRYGKDGFTDSKTVLDPEDDAATANWGGAWRMPTKAERDELLNNCRWDWTTQNGVNGYKVTGPNGNSIFLPAAGHMSEGALRYAGLRGYYWSSSLDTDNLGSAYYVYFSSDKLYRDYDDCCYGLSVRPVCK